MKTILDGTFIALFLPALSKSLIIKNMGEAKKLKVAKQLLEDLITEIKEKGLTNIGLILERVEAAVDILP